MSDSLCIDATWGEGTSVHRLNIWQFFTYSQLTPDSDQSFFFLISEFASWFMIVQQKIRNERNRAVAKI